MLFLLKETFKIDLRHIFHFMNVKFLLILPTLINIFEHSAIKVFAKKHYKNVTSSIAKFRDFMFFIWMQFFFETHKKKNMEKKSGDVNPHYLQCLKPQSERVVSYNHLLTEWYYYIFLRLLFWFLVFLKTVFFWKIFSKQLPSPKWMTYLNKKSIN